MWDWQVMRDGSDHEHGHNSRIILLVWLRADEQPRLVSINRMYFYYPVRIRYLLIEGPFSAQRVSGPAPEAHTPPGILHRLGLSIPGYHWLVEGDPRPVEPE